MWAADGGFEIKGIHHALAMQPLGGDWPPSSAYISSVNESGLLFVS